MQKLVPLDDLEKVTRNRYEAVLVAAKRARSLNAQRKQAEEQAGTDSLASDARRVTAQALEELLKGQLKFVRMQ